MSHELFYQHIRSLWNETMGEGNKWMTNIFILCSKIICVMTFSMNSHEKVS